MVTRVLFRCKTTPRFRMFHRMMRQSIYICSFITTMFTLMNFRRDRCNKFFEISEDMVIKRCFSFKYRIAMVTRIPCNTTPRFRMFRQMTI
ncbi:unnamed protein product, partial [Callosobruchus maculatus]